MELYKACEKKALLYSLYYSYAADWKHPYFYAREKVGNTPDLAYKNPQPEYLFKKDEDFKIYTEFVHNQIKELLNQYPNIAGIWFDPVLAITTDPIFFQ